MTVSNVFVLKASYYKLCQGFLNKGDASSQGFHKMLFKVVLSGREKVRQVGSLHPNTKLWWLEQNQTRSESGELAYKLRSPIWRQLNGKLRRFSANFTLSQTIFMKL